MLRSQWNECLNRLLVFNADRQMYFKIIGISRHQKGAAIQQNFIGLHDTLKSIFIK